MNFHPATRAPVLAWIFCTLLAADTAAIGAGLVAAYNFDEGAGVIAADASGNSHTGMLAGVSWTVSGKNGAAVSFNGSSGAITVVAASDLNLSSSFTLSAWVRPAALSGYQTVFIKETSGNGSYWLQTLGNQVDSGIFDGSFREHLTTTANLSVNTWFHLASVFDDANNTFKIYVNGTLVLNETETGAMLANGQNLVFGQSHVGERWNGLVDDVRIYSRALSQAEIQSDMNTPVGGTPSPPDNTPPTVAILSPANGAVLWGVTTASAVAADLDSGVAGVQFKLDGVDLGAEIGAPPFNLVWNTTTVASGAHTLTAVARNLSSVATTSNPVNLTVTAAPSRLLRKSASGRHLVDRGGAPFLMAGDAPQSLTVNLSTNEADFYFADRQAHGFNTLWVNLLCNDGTAGRIDGGTYDGILPFTGYLGGHSGDPEYYDLLTPNTNFFARCDWMIAQAAKYGLVFLLDPAECIGFLRNNGSAGVLLHNGTNACRAYGQFLGNRYRNFDNIIWMSGNDFQNWSTPAADAVVTAVARGIQDTDTNHIHTVELDYLTSGSLDDPNWWPIISLNASYTYYPTYAQVLNDYNRTNFQPVFLVEANYEFESLQGPVTIAPILRRQEYWALLSGACGQLYGSYYTWRLPSGWQSFLDSPGALQMPNLKSLFESRAWSNLVPDQNHSVLTAGYGTFSSGGYVADNDYASCARTGDGSLLIAYMPTLRTLTIAMTNLATAATARWYDPANGTYVSIPGSPFANSGSRNFTPPGNNSDGDGDWVLVLETNPPRPVITAATLTGSDCEIQFTSLSGTRYDLESKTDLASGVWSVTATNVPGSGGIIQVTDFGVASQPAKFYRIRQSP